MTCLSQLAGALLEVSDRARDPEQRLVKVAHERAPVVVQEDCDEHAAHELAARLPQLHGELRTLRRCRAEQRGRTHGRGPAPVALPERGLERMPELLAAERYGLGFDYLEKYRKEVEAVTPADVQAMAKKHLDPKALAIVAVGAIDKDGKQLGKKK